MEEDTIQCLENLFLGLGDKTRLKLLSLMAEGPAAVGYLVEKTGDSQPKVSRHLAYLRNAGLVEPRRDGKWIYYAIAEQKNAECADVMRSVVASLGGQDLPGHVVPRAELQSEPIGDEFEQLVNGIEDRSLKSDVDDNGSSVQRREELEIFLL